MAGAVVAIASVISSVASAVAAAISPIAAAIAGALGPAVAAIGKVLSTIMAALGTTMAPLLKTMGGIANWIVTSVGQSVGSLVKTVAETVKPFTQAIGKALGTVMKAIDTATKPILEPIRGGLEIVHKKLQAVADWVTTAFHPSAELDSLKAAHPEIWEMAEYDNATFIFHMEDLGMISSTKATLLGLPDVFQTINQVATLKILSDLVKGQASVADLLGKVAEGKSLETAAAIAQLSKSIAVTSVGLMDRVDSEVGLLRATMDSFDERLTTSLRNYASQTKAEVLAVMTPKITVLGKYQLQLNSDIARLTRHIEDEAWFGAMLLRFLT